MDPSLFISDRKIWKHRLQFPLRIYSQVTFIRRRLVNSTLIPCLHTDNFDLPVQIAVALLTSSPMLKWESPVRRQYLPPYAREAQSFALFPIGKWHGGCGKVCSMKIVFISSFVESFSIVKGDFCNGVDRTSSGF